MGRKRKGPVATVVEFAIFYLFYRFFRLLPVRAAYALGRGIFVLVFRLDRKHRERTLDHLLHAGVVRTRSEAWRMARLNFIHYSRLMVEIIKSDQLFNRSNFREHFSLCGDPEAIRCFFEQDPPAQAIITLAHYGNWEVAGYAYNLLTGRCVVSIKRPLTNPLINRMIMRQREREGHEGVEKRGALKGMLRALKDGKTVAVLVDQHASSSEGVETLFFGQPARTHMSPALLHLRTGVPILVGICRRKPGHEFAFEFVLGKVIRYAPTDDKEFDLRAVAQRYTDELESLIRQEPIQWMWVHRRWLNLNRRSDRDSAESPPVI